MDSLAGLDEIDWAALEHAYGPATDIPPLLRQLAAPGLTEESAQGIFGTFYANIYHQGSRYTSSVAAVPFLVAILDAPTTSNTVRGWLIRLLVDLAVADPVWLLPKNFSVEVELKRAAEMQTPEYEAKIIAEDAKWLMDDDTDEERERMRKNSIKRNQGRVQGALAAVQAHEAVKEALPVLYRLLKDPEPQLRALASYAVAWFSTQVDATSRELFALLENEPILETRATALISLGVLQAPQSISEAAEERRRVTETTISQFLLHFFQTKEIHELVKFCCATAIILSGFAQREHVAEVVQVLAEPATLEKYVVRREDDNGLSDVFPFGGISVLAAKALSTVRGRTNPDVLIAFARIIVERSRTLNTMSMLSTISASLQIAFDGKPFTAETLPPFEQLSVPQQTLVRAIAQLKQWNSGNLMMELRRWGLPTMKDDFRIYAQTEEQQQC
ncbi:hypothetical protein MKEN_00110100 [Mycena kentingensis (nom. inval.)]|nr:hypothetical protein MKEN_00110100 [Mycena kentingensis (nom. inval.)]